MGKRPKKPIGEQFFAIRMSLLNSELFNKCLTPDDWFLYLAYGRKFEGNMHQKITVTFDEVRYQFNNNKDRYRKSKFHLAAFRVLYFPYFGCQDRRASVAKISMKWKTLVCIPEKLNKIANWVKEYDDLMKKSISKNPGESREMVVKLRRRIAKKLSDKIFGESV